MLVIWALGFILICALRTPIAYYQYYDRFVVIHSHIFSNRGKILAGQFILYNLIWGGFVILIYLLFKYLSGQKR